MFRASQLSATAGQGPPDHAEEDDRHASACAENGRDAEGFDTKPDERVGSLASFFNLWGRRRPGTWILLGRLLATVG